MSWRSIPGLPMYEASDNGLIRSKARSVTTIVNGRRVRKVLPSKLLAQSLMTLNGRPHYVTAKVNGQTLYVHRLVAMAWHADTYFVPERRSTTSTATLATTAPRTSNGSLTGKISSIRTGRFKRRANALKPGMADGWITVGARRGIRSRVRNGGIHHDGA